MADETEPPTCSKCGEEPPGPGGVLCPGCVARIKNTLAHVYDD